MNWIKRTATMVAAMMTCLFAAATPPGDTANRLEEWAVSKPHPATVDASRILPIDVSVLDDEIKRLIQASKNDDSRSFRSGYKSTYLPAEKVILYEDPDHYHPSLVLNREPVLDLVIESPHAGLETGTAYQAAFLLHATGARALILSGMHRCAMSEYSRCDGKTAVCGTREAYRTSDAAHFSDGIFQRIHEVLTRVWSNSIVIQLHEMLPSEKGMMVIISSTIREHESRDGLIAKFRGDLKRRLQDQISIFSCQNPDDIDTGFRRLCGFSNVQGRSLNGSTQPCIQAATSSRERFIHIEQDYRITSDTWYLERLAASIRDIARSISPSPTHGSGGTRRHDCDDFSTQSQSI